MGRVRWLDICDQGRSAFRIPYLFCLSSLICPTPTITHSRHQSQIFFSPQHKQPAPANRHSPAILNHRNCNNARRHSEDSPTPNLIWTMKLELSTLILRVCVVSSLATLTWAHRRGHCSELTGIVSGGGSGQLDLDILNTTFQAEPFDFLDDPENPIVPTVAACSSKLETPISMRNLLGEFLMAITVWFSALAEFFFFFLIIIWYSSIFRVSIFFGSCLIFRKLLQQGKVGDLSKSLHLLCRRTLRTAVFSPFDTRNKQYSSIARTPLLSLSLSLLLSEANIYVRPRSFPIFGQSLHLSRLYITEA